MLLRPLCSVAAMANMRRYAALLRRHYRFSIINTLREAAADSAALIICRFADYSPPPLADARLLPILVGAILLSRGATRYARYCC